MRFPCFVLTNSLINSVIPRNNTVDSRIHDVIRRNYTDNLEIRAFLCIFTCRKKQVFI